MGRPTWFQFQGGFQCWTWNWLTAGLGIKSLRWKICQKTAMEVVDFVVDFCGGFLVTKCKRRIRRKNRPENPPAEKKNPPAHDPPEIRLAGPKIRRKNYQQIRLSNLQVHAGFFRLRRFALGGVFRAWILGHSLAAFWAWLRLPRWNAPAIKSLSCCWWDGQGLLHTLPDNTFSQKRSLWENGQKQKIRHATLPPLAAQGNALKIGVLAAIENWNFGAPKTSLPAFKAPQKTV